MNYGQLKTAFETRLKRRDLPTGASGEYIQQGISRIQRTLRVPAMETTETVVIDGSYDPDVGIDVPSDLLGLINISTINGSLRRAGLIEVLGAVTEVGVPRIFAQRGLTYLLGPYPLDADEIRIDYFAAPAALSDNTDSNFLSIYAPDIIIYAALVYAADDYLDRRGPTWSQNYTALLAEYQAQADMDYLSGSSVAPTHFYDSAD